LNFYPQGNGTNDDQRRNEGDAFASLHGFGIPPNPIDLDPQKESFTTNLSRTN